MKRTLLRIVVGLIVINAALAVFALLSGDIGDTEGKILLTSLIATLTAVLAMMCAPAFTARRLGPVPLAGIAAAIVGFGLVVAAIWGEVGGEWFGKAVGTAYAVAAATALACLLSAWPIRGGASWVGSMANALIALATAAILGGMWLEIDSGGYWRGFAVLAVLVAAASLAVPVLHRSGASTADASVTHCPFDGTSLQGRAGAAVTCPSCGRRFTVTLHQ